MNNEFTAKEIQTFMFLHDFRKNAGRGEITVTFHNRDFDKLKNIQCEFLLSGQTASIEFYEKLLGLMGIVSE